MIKVNLLDEFSVNDFYGSMSHYYDIETGKAEYHIRLNSRDLSYLKAATFDDFSLATARYKEAARLADLAVDYKHMIGQPTKGMMSDQHPRLSSMLDACFENEDKPFYEEKWYMEDLEEAIDTYKLDGEQVEELKDAVRGSFGDHSVRNEIIMDRAAELSKGTRVVEKDIDQYLMDGIDIKKRDDQDLVSEEESIESAEELVSEEEFIPEDMKEFAEELVLEPSGPEMVKADEDISMNGSGVVNDEISKTNDFKKEQGVDFPDVPENGMTYSVILNYTPKGNGEPQFDMIERGKDADSFFEAQAWAYKYISDNPELAKEMESANFIVRFYEKGDDSLSSRPVFVDSCSADERDLLKMSGMDDREISGFLLDEKNELDPVLSEMYESPDDSVVFNEIPFSKEEQEALQQLDKEMAKTDIKVPNTEASR